MKTNLEFFINIGSKNPTKVKGIQEGIDNFRKFFIKKHSQVDINFDFFSYKVASEVSAQPLSFFETYKGAQNRAENSFLKFDNNILKTLKKQKNKVLLGIGIEGGVIYFCDKFFSINVVSIYDGKEFYDYASGIINIPDWIGEKIVFEKKEMAQVFDENFKEKNIRSKNGAIGVFTDDFITRTSLYKDMSSVVFSLYFKKNFKKLF